MKQKLTLSQRLKARLPLLSGIALIIAMLLAITIIVCLIKAAFL